jgi:hypothetical protein
MNLEYTNRRGDRYYVLQGRTKTGKAKYYCARKQDGIGVAEMPPDFEIYEHPESALVSVRRIRSTRLLPCEAKFLEEQVRKLAGIEHFIIGRDGDSLVVYVCDRNPDAVNNVLEKLCGPLGAHSDQNRQWVLQNAHYSPMYRFTLKDENERWFVLERWCYRGRIEGWFPLAKCRPLDELAADFLPRLGQKSFSN